jgi:hypothetical protein
LCNQDDRDLKFFGEKLKRLNRLAYFLDLIDKGPAKKMKVVEYYKF